MKRHCKLGDMRWEGKGRGAGGKNSKKGGGLKKKQQGDHGKQLVRPVSRYSVVHRQEATHLVNQLWLYYVLETN